jgi:hypothetical protein
LVCGSYQIDVKTLYRFTRNIKANHAERHHSQNKAI